MQGTARPMTDVARPEGPPRPASHRGPSRRWCARRAATSSGTRRCSSASSTTSPPTASSSPRSAEDVVAALAACYELGIPVTPRGTGTGNYGQAMPLSRGAILDLSAMDKVLSIAPGPRPRRGRRRHPRRRPRRPRPHSGQEMRLHPSTAKTATVGGFVAGGSGGVGSITWGGLRDFGNIIGLKVVTMEARPRILDLTGEDIHKVSHAYGTNGIIVEVEMPLAPAYDWVDVIAGFDSLAAAAAFANALGEADGILKKQLAVVAAPAPHDYFNRHRRWLPRDRHVVCAMIAPQAYDAFLTLLPRAAARARLAVLDRGHERGRPQGPARDLRARLEPHDAAGAQDRSGHHLSPDALSLSRPARSRRAHPRPFRRRSCRRISNSSASTARSPASACPSCASPPRSGSTRSSRSTRTMGAPVFNPHRYTLEEGGMKQTDAHAARLQARGRSRRACSIPAR